MKHTTHYAGLLLGLGLLSAGTASATNITITDNQPITWGFTGNSGGSPLVVGGLGQGGEDNEVETHQSPTKLTSSYVKLTSGPDTTNFYLNVTRNQAWDLEGLFLNGNTLSIVGGYDFLNGLSGGRPGDLFIKVGGSQPTSGPSLAPGSILNTMGYTHVVDLSASAWTGSGTYVPTGAFGSSVPWYTLGANSSLRSVIYDQVGSNPWKYDDGGQGGTAALGYFTGTNGVGAGFTMGKALNGGVDFAGTSFRNVLQVDLSAILSNAAHGTDIWFSYTMECGNDSIKGKTRVPDGGITSILLGIALFAMTFGRRMVRRN